MARISFIDSQSTTKRGSSEDLIQLADPRLYRNPLRLFLALLALLLITQSVLNFALNPAGTFRPSGVLLESIRSSDTHLKLEALDEFLERTEGSEITLALGSSRMLLMSFSADNVPDSLFFNAATSGGQSEDILAFTRYILEQPNIRLSRVYINTDPNFLSENTAYGSRLDGVYVLDQETSSHQNVRTEFENVLGAILTNDWFRATLEHLQSDGPPSVDFDVRSGIRDENAAFASRLETAGSREAMLNQHVDRSIESASSIEISPRRLEDLQTTVGLLVDHGAEVVLIFMPHQSRLWTGLMADHNYRQQTEQTRQELTVLAQDPKVIFCDFADPTILGLDSDVYWWDGVHYTSDASEIISEGVAACVMAGGSGRKNNR